MKLTITKPVVDLLKAPSHIDTRDYSHNDHRLTQLLFNDEVEVIEASGEWLFVGARAQLCYRENLGWHPYQGWIHKSDAIHSQSLPPTHVISAKKLELDGMILSFGTLLHLEGSSLILPNGKRNQAPTHSLRALSDSFSAKRLVEDAASFLGDPYLWGGASAYGSAEIASLDCSGLIYLLYRAQGIFLPRDAHDQWMKSEPTSLENLKIGDLLYLAPEDRPDRISHVLLYPGAGHLMEAPQTNEKIRSFPISTHLSHDGNCIRIKGREKRYFPHFRTFGRNSNV